MEHVHHTFYITRYLGMKFDVEGRKIKLEGEVFGNYNPATLSRRMRRDNNDETIVIMSTNVSRQKFIMEAEKFRELAQRVQAKEKRDDQDGN